MSEIKRPRFRKFEPYISARRALFKMTHSKAYGHMAAGYPFLRLEDEGDRWHIFWKGLDAGYTASWQSIITSAPNRVFAIGSGPSIAEQDLSHLSGSECILVNGAIELVINETIGVPFAVMIEDARFVYERSKMLLALPKGVRLCLTLSAFHALGVVAGLEGLKHFDLMLIDGFETPYGKAARTVNQVEKSNYRVSKNAKLSLNLQQGHFGCGTVMYCAIQMAFHIKAKELFLVGFDLTNFEQPRFYETEQDAAWTGLQNAYESRILPALELVMAAADEFDMEVFNCSHTSIVPKELIPFSNVLKKSS